MKYIKRYLNGIDFGDAGNIPPLVWYCSKNNYPDGGFSYSVERRPTSETVEMTYKGKVNESVPGVAYLKTSDLGSGRTCYNNDIGLPKIYTEKIVRTTTWEEFGITQELYDRYLSLAKGYIFPPDFNITVGGVNCAGVSYAKSDGITNYDCISFDCGYFFIVQSNGVVDIISNID